jgi:hypothetical protein
LQSVIKEEQAYSNEDFDYEQLKVEFDDIDEDIKYAILMDEDITDDIYVYGKIIKDSIKVEIV